MFQSSFGIVKWRMLTVSPLSATRPMCQILLAYLVHNWPSLVSVTVNNQTPFEALR